MAACKVLQLGSPTGLYGAERWILALARYLDRAEVDTTIAVIRDDPSLAAPLCEQARALGFESHIFDAPGRINWSAVTQLRRYLVDRSIDVLHTHGYKTDIIGLLAARGTRCRLLSTPHGWSVKAGPALAFYEWLDRLAFLGFDAVAPLSEGIHQDLESIPRLRARLHLIRNGVDIGEIDSVTGIAPDVAQWREQGEFVIGYVGQLIERKGLMVLLEAFAQLGIPRRKLALIGEGPQRAELEARAKALGIAEQVHFFGFRSDRLALMRGFHVFALPSRLEGIPRCLMESMAASVAIVSSDIPGSRDLVTDGQTGLLFPVDDVSALSARLKQCEDPALRAALIERARAFVVEKYSAESMARSYQALYRDLAMRGARG